MAGDAANRRTQAPRAKLVHVRCDLTLSRTGCLPFLTSMAAAACHAKVGCPHVATRRWISPVLPISTPRRRVLRATRASRGRLEQGDPTRRYLATATLLLHLQVKVRGLSCVVASL